MQRVAARVKPKPRGLRGAPADAASCVEEATADEPAVDPRLTSGRRPCDGCRAHENDKKTTRPLRMHAAPCLHHHAHVAAAHVDAGRPLGVLRCRGLASAHRTARILPAAFVPAPTFDSTRLRARHERPRRMRLS